MLKGNDIYWILYGLTQSSGYLKRGWLNWSMNRHPLLTNRTSQVIKRVRADATEEGTKITDDCIFNMEKTGFAHNNKTRKVITLTR